MINDVSPLTGIDVSFQHYVDSRLRAESRHMKCGVPDYAFALDYELKRNLAKIPHFEPICRSVVSTAVTREIQQLNRTALVVGPTQFEEIYAMGVDCAHRLGIGVPNIFVVNDPAMNAYTIAADDASPLVCVNSGLIERLTPGELKCVIAHECSHIQNNHTVYRYVVSSLTSGMSGTLGMLISQASMLMMTLWTRACEVTADRAASICADSLEDIVDLNAKLMYGAMLGDHRQLDTDALRAQLDTALSNPSRILEGLSDHPGQVRRIFLSKEFEECAVLYDWRPEFRRPDSILRSKDETDARCKRIVNLVNNKGWDD